MHMQLMTMSMTHSQLGRGDIQIHHQGNNFLVDKDIEILLCMQNLMDNRSILML